MSWVSGYNAVLNWSYRKGVPTDTPGLSRPPERTSTVAKSSARRSGFSNPSGMTAVPNVIRLVRWLAAARRATGEEMRGLEMPLAYPHAVEAKLLGALDQPQCLFMAGRRIRRIELSDGQEPEPAQRRSAVRHGRDSTGRRALCHGRKRRLLEMSSLIDVMAATLWRP